MKAYYLMYAARYGQGVMSVLIEHKRKDFWEMMTHHTVTVSLIGTVCAPLGPVHIHHGVFASVPPAHILNRVFGLVGPVHIQR